jgi:hypothetical protein
MGETPAELPFIGDQVVCLSNDQAARSGPRKEARPAWDKGPTAFIHVTTPGAVYTRLAINGAQTRLYAADDVPPGRIDVFDIFFGPLNLARE